MDQPTNEFEKAAQKGAGENLLTEFWGFLCTSKKWWLLPLLLILLVLGVLMVLSGSFAAPFIYTLF
ncbi:hypothetical protein AYO44_13120 [Planctomycetaceae bacterium SCGC AG-212-F19]|nr:hypothetical protein AYO44_13120 [Planctomycetaceae bacterium SCGC AG-212-F19]